MVQKELNEENKEIKSRERMQFILLAIVGILCLVVAVLSIMLFRHSPKMELSEKSLSDLKVMLLEQSEKSLSGLKIMLTEQSEKNLKVMMLVLDQKADEDIVAFGDTHFGYDKSTLTNEAKTLLNKDVQVLKENPKMKVRMAGYTSAQGTEEGNQKLSEGRANAVRNYLIEKGIAPGRITIIGYGRTKPALYEVSPGAINTKAAKANMRVLFEIVVK